MSDKLAEARAIIKDNLVVMANLEKRHSELLASHAKANAKHDERMRKIDSKLKALSDTSAVSRAEPRHAPSRNLPRS